MKISLIPSDSVAIIDGVARKISFSGVAPLIHAIQFDTMKGKGHVEFLQDLEPRVDNLEITDLAGAQVFVDRWVTAAPPPPDPVLPPEPDPIDELRTALIADPTLLNKLKAVK